MSEPGCESITVQFGLHGNDVEFLLEGWSGPEEGFRWAVGPQSALRLPHRMGTDDVLLTISATPARTATRPGQTVLVNVNDRLVGRLMLYGPGEHAIVLRHTWLCRDRENVIRFLFGHSFNSRELDPREERELAVSFHQLRLEHTNLEVFAAPEVLPAPAVDQWSQPALRELAERFESLGQNCEFGMWQRRCEAEPLGLLRFASARINNVLIGVRTNFLAIDEPGQLTMSSGRPGGEYMGHHDFYELDYHTFRYEGQVDLNSFFPKEPARLRYLARELMAQITCAERIFVIQRGNPQLTQEEVIPLLLAMRERNSQVALLYVTALGSEFASLRGRVERCATGLFHGYLERLAPAEHAYDCDVEGWLRICSTVAAALPG